MFLEAIRLHHLCLGTAWSDSLNSLGPRVFLAILREADKDNKFIHASVHVIRSYQPHVDTDFYTMTH